MLPANLIIRLAASLSFYGSYTLIKKKTFYFRNIAYDLGSLIVGERKYLSFLKLQNKLFLE